MSKTGLDAYVWQREGAHLAVHLRRSAMSQLRAKGETTGVLLGRRGTLNGKPVVIIEAARPIERSNIPTAVGFYRTGAVTNELSAADRDLLDRYLPGSPSVFLLIGPERLAATLFFCYQGHITLFDETTLGDPLTNAKHRRRPGKLHGKSLAVGASVLLGLIIAGIAWRLQSQPTPQPQPVQIATPTDQIRVEPPPTPKPSPLLRARQTEPSPVRKLQPVIPELPPPIAEPPPAARSGRHSVLSAPLRFTKWLFHSRRPT